MQYIVYDKHDGSILLIKKGGSVKITVDSAKSMFEGKDVGVWKMEDRILSVKNNKIALDKNGDPRGIIIYEGVKEYEIDDFGKKNVNAKKIVYKGVFYDHGGYANMNREIALRLAKMEDVDLRVEIVPSGKQIDNLTFEKLNYLSKKNIPASGSVNIVGFTPMGTDVSNFNIFFTMMETQTLHPDFANVCNRYADAIMTPTMWNKDVFLKGGIRRPIHVVPLGVSTDIYKPGVPKLPIQCRELPSGKLENKFPSFNYITLFGWSYRKGIDVILKSYCDRFTSKDDVGFIICSRYMGGSDKKQKRIVERDILGFMKNYSDPPRVYYYGESTPIESMPNLMANGDCFIWGSRGEGFGLPIIEAASMGIPVVSTYNSAMTDFLTEDNSFIVHTDKFVTAPRNITCISPYYVGQLFPELGDSVIKKFGERMREVYDNYSLAERKASVFSSQIKEKYTWDICAKNVYKVLKKIEKGS